MPIEHRTDQQVADDVVDALTWDTRVDHRRISVAVSGGVVTLNGTVDTNAEKMIAHDDVTRLKGVERLVNNLSIAAPETMADDVLTAAVIDALTTDSRVDAKKVSVRVARGVVTLTGEVRTEGERRTAVEDASYVVGVTSVIDNLSITPMPFLVDRDAEAAVYAKIAADTRIVDPTTIFVKARNGRVYLRGGVLSAHERNSAEEDARSVGGILDVIDELAIITAPMHSLAPPRARAA